MPVTRFVHNPIFIDAVQYDGSEENLKEISELLGFQGVIVSEGFFRRDTRDTHAIKRNDGNFYPLKAGDWVIKRDSGCIYTCTEQSMNRNYSSYGDSAIFNMLSLNTMVAQLVMETLELWKPWRATARVLRNNALNALRTQHAANVKIMRAHNEEFERD